MIFSHKVIPDNLVVKIRNQNISRTGSMSFLGVAIDEKLTFVDHIDELSRKVAKSVGIIYRISSFIPETILPNLYFSLIHSRLSYGITAWGGASDSNLLRLQKLHRRVLNLIPSAASCKILNFSNIYKYFSCLKFFKSAKLGHHAYFSQIIHDLLPVYNYNTQHAISGNVNIPIHRKTRCQQSFLFKATFVWNNLPDGIKNCLSLSIF